jgi:hypothetical protein
MYGINYFLHSKYKEVFPCQVDHQQNEMIKNNIIVPNEFLKEYVQCISKEFEKIRNDGERHFENKKFGLP